MEVPIASVARTDLLPTTDRCRVSRFCDCIVFLWPWSRDGFAVRHAGATATKL